MNNPIETASFQKKTQFNIEKRYEELLSEVSKLVQKWNDSKFQNESDQLSEIHSEKKSFETNFPGLFRSGVVSSCGYGSKNPVCVFVSETPRFIFKKKKKQMNDNDFQSLLLGNYDEEDEELQETVDDKYVSIFDECLLLESLKEKKGFLHYFPTPLSKDYSPSPLVYELFLHFFTKEIEILKPKVVFIYSFPLFNFLKTKPLGVPYGYSSFFKENYQVCRTPNGHSFYLEFIRNPWKIVNPDPNLKKEEIQNERDNYIKQIREDIGRFTKTIMSNNYLKDENGQFIEKFGSKVLDVSELLKKNTQEALKKQTERKSRLLDQKKTKETIKKLSTQKTDRLTKVLSKKVKTESDD